jgi:hypothetical protein
MKKVVLGLIAATLMLSTANAEPNKGQKIYLKKAKKSCGVSGAKIAGKHTQDEWIKIKEEGKIKNELSNLCNGLEVKEKYIDDLFDFFYEYASDSGNVPSC